MSVLSEKTIGDANLGSTTRILLQNLDPHLRELKELAITDLKQEFRSGLLDQSKMISGVAKLVALEDLEIRLKQMINRGIAAAKEMNSVHPTN